MRSPRRGRQMPFVGTGQQSRGLLGVAPGGQAVVTPFSAVLELLGAVVGPSESVDGEIALFDGLTGKRLKRAMGTGIVAVADGVMSVVAVSGDPDTYLAGDLNFTVPSGTGGGAFFMSPLTTGGDPTTAELVFAPNGDVVMVPEYF